MSFNNCIQFLHRKQKQANRKKINNKQTKPPSQSIGRLRTQSFEKYRADKHCLQLTAE